MQKNALLGALFLTLASCTSSTGAWDDEGIHISEDGTEFTVLHSTYHRRGRIYVPENLDPTQPISLVFGLHGAGSTAEDFQAYGFDAHAERLNFIMIYPQGSDHQYTWRPATGQQTDQDDYGYFRRLLRYFSGKYGVDPKRIYLTGHSLGAIMVYRLAHDLSEWFAAIAPVAGYLPVPYLVLGTFNPIPGPRIHPRALSVLHLHDPQDRITPLAGDPRYSLSVHDTLQFWVDRAGIQDYRILPPANLPGPIQWSQAGYEVAYRAYPDQGHLWFDGATELIADFFFNHPARHTSAVSIGR